MYIRETNINFKNVILLYSAELKLMIWGDWVNLLSTIGHYTKFVEILTEN